MKNSGSQTQYRRKALFLSITTISALALIPASSQAQNEAPQALEEIRVTGTRIARTSGMETPVPVTSITTQELFDQEPGSTISQQLDGLPQFFNNGTSQKLKAIDWAGHKERIHTAGVVEKVHNKYNNFLKSSYSVDAAVGRLGHTTE